MTYTLIDAPVTPADGVPALEAWRAELAAMPDNDLGVQAARREVERWLAAARRLPPP